MTDQRGTFLNHDDVSEEEEEDNEGPLSPTSTVTRARPDSTAEPLQSPLNPNSPTTVCNRHRSMELYHSANNITSGQRTARAFKRSTLSSWDRLTWASLPSSRKPSTSRARPPTRYPHEKCQ
jgi:hypothetical protein